MELTWNNMEKKEKLMWIKKAAEDQKRYEVGRGCGHLPPPKTQRRFGCTAFFAAWGLEPKVPALV